MPIGLKRIYDDVEKSDGVRVLVDRIWPRGVKKEDAEITEWAKEVAPTDELRKWFNHEADKFADFKKKYKEELQTGEQEKAMKELKERVKKENKNVTLVYAAKDEKNNQAIVLKEILDHQ